MKHLFLFYTIIVILFLGCSKDKNQDFDEFSKDSGTFIDERDGHEYKWVKIGDQIWMAENLAYLPQVRPPSFPTKIDDSFNPYYYIMEYDGSTVEEAKKTESFKKYGVLYNWAAAMDGEERITNSNIEGSDLIPSGIQGVCPSDWHLPSKSEWQQLDEFICNIESDYSGFPYHECNIGKYLKTLSGWFIERDINGNGLDTYGFSALPGGYRDYEGDFGGLLRVGNWWSTSIDGIGIRGANAFKYSLIHGHNFSSINTTKGSNGISVRCIKD